jgi:hypothetical protein
MFHRNRTWCLSEAEFAEDLAKKLTELTWCLCAGFTVKGHPNYLFLNDATSPDGAQEYAILKRDCERFVQIESITFSWMDEAKALEYIRRTFTGEFDTSDFAHEVTLNLQTPAEHGRCPFCT